MNTTIEIMELRALSAVVAQGSFTSAADTLGTDKAHVSRIVTRLERKLGARLLERSTRRLNVTEVGREVVERATGILLALEETENSVAQSRDAPTGKLRLTAGAEFGLLVVNSWVAAYLRAYPEMAVEAEFTNRVTDIIHEGFDVAIRLGRLPDSEFSARKLGEIGYSFYASPSYLQDRERPDRPQDLAAHDIVAFAPRGQPRWTVVKGRESLTLAPKARYQVNNNQAALGMVVGGLGIALLPSFMAAPEVRKGALDVVLPDWRPIPVAVHAVFASSRYLAPKVRAFVDLAKDQFGAS